MLGDCLKVHFAGSESYRWATILDTANVRYCLYTCFPWIWSMVRGSKRRAPPNGVFVPDYIQSFTKHSIMDSGVYSLMFGEAARPEGYDEPFMERWQDAIIEFVLSNNIRSTIVEVDCQKILGVRQAWKLRRKLREAIPNRISFGLGFGWLFTPDGRRQLLAMMVGQYCVKFLLAALDTPFFYFFTRRANTAAGLQSGE